MRFRRGSLRRLLISLLALATHPALSQNLLVNPGFDRDLAGWTIVLTGYPSTATVRAFAVWAATDASGSAASGGLALHAAAETAHVNKAAATQCLAVSPGTLATIGARILTTRQFMTAAASVAVSYFPTADCSGTALMRASTDSLPFVTRETNSGGRWLLTTTQALASPGSLSVLAEVSVDATGTFFYGSSEVDAVADDAFLTLTAAGTTTWILPSAAWVFGVGRSAWTTQFTLSNPGSTDAAVTFKWLGHDADGRGGPETAYVVRAGQTFVPDESTLWLNHQEDYGAILVTTSSSALIVQSETSTYVASGGTVGQALPAFGPADYASATPKTLAPIRENASFRTNLVLANPTEAALTAHVALFAADGAPIGTRDVELPPLGMTQISRVASTLGATTLDVGRIAVSTPTPGGPVAAYASIIDNVTNDPRTILPQDAVAAPTRNLLVNHGFDRDLLGWGVSSNFSGYGGAGAGWDSADVAASTASGSASLGASASAGPGSGTVSVSQCVAISPGRLYGLRSWVRTSGWTFFGSIPSPALGMRFFGTIDCSGTSSATSISSVRPFNAIQGSGADWFTLFAPTATAPASAKSALALLGVGVGAGVHGLGISATFDDVVFAEGPSAWTSFLPAAASVIGSGGSHWTTDLSLANAGADDASVYLEFLDSGPGGAFSWVTNVRAGETVSFRDVLVTLFQRNLSWGPLRITATSSDIAITAETSSPTASGGSVGQALAAIAPRDLIGATAKSIAPVRDDSAFRTNLVLSNATDSSLIAHVELFDAAGVLVGARDIPLGPLAAAQIGGVGWALAGASVNPGRLAVSTSTPGGLVAAYASVIDNVTNDPRTILPR